MYTKSSRRRIDLPPAPTAAPPGSEEKVRILVQRARLGVALWHPLDAKLPAAAADVSPSRHCLAS